MNVTLSILIFLLSCFNFVFNSFLVSRPPNDVKQKTMNNTHTTTQYLSNNSFPVLSQHQEITLFYFSFCFFNFENILIQVAELLKRNIGRPVSCTLVKVTLTLDLNLESRCVVLTFESVD